ncbi:MAG: hypothetical protein J7494_02385 [Sphingobium sp.]|nr:hypothetical protein [Sphingobium sp.]
MVRKLHRMMAVMLGAAMLPVAAQGQSVAESKSAGRIATQPVRDVGLSKDKIPSILEAAVADPYGLRSSRCKAVVAELEELNEALGRDFDSPPVKGDKVSQIASAGGEAIVNSLIPFRGLVREVTGAAGAERRKIAAINAGIARRGFLRGIAKDHRCKVPPPPPPKAEKDEEERKGEGEKGEEGK